MPFLEVEVHKYINVTFLLCIVTRIFIIASKSRILGINALCFEVITIIDMIDEVELNGDSFYINDSYGVNFVTFDLMNDFCGKNSHYDCSSKVSCQ